MGHATAFICVTCKGQDGGPEQPGRLLFEAVKTGLRDHPRNNVTVTAVECLSVCKRPCTIALTAPGKWTYIFGDLHHHDHVADVIRSAVLYDASETGIIPWRERPPSVRRGVVSRIPPIGFSPDQT